MSKPTNKFSPEVRDRAVRIVDERRADYGSEWAAMTSTAGKIGCTAGTSGAKSRRQRSAQGALAVRGPHMDSGLFALESRYLHNR
jgi:transposase-like protein